MADRGTLPAEALPAAAQRVICRRMQQSWQSGITHATCRASLPSGLNGNPMLQIDDLVFNAWGRRFFDHASVLIPSNAKVGLVGRNGVGKSTLFKLILGELSADGGEISLPKAARGASVDQEQPATPVSLLDTILAADRQRDALHAELETA